MAFLFGDSFDFYTVSANTDPTLYGPWTAITGTNPTVSSTVTRFSLGKSINFATANSWMSKTLSANTSATIFLAFAMIVNGSLNGSATTIYHSIHFSDGAATTAANTQVMVQVCGDGAIRVYRGGAAASGTTGGTLLGTYTSAIAGSTWTHFQIKIVISDASGEVHIRKNGNTADDFSVTSVDTKSTANAYCNQVWIGSPAGGGYYDDLMFYDDSGSTPNDWVGDIRCYTVSPTANTTQKDFSPSLVTTQVGTSSSANSAAFSTANQHFVAFTPGFSGTIDTIAVGLSTGLTGNMKMGIYADSGGAATGSALATTAEIVNPTAGHQHNALSSSLHVTAGTQYWISWQTNATPTYATFAGSVCRTQSNTYSSGLTASANATGTVSVLTPTIQYHYSVDNFSAVSQTTPDGDSSYTYSSTVGALDLFDTADLASTPTAIYAVVVRAAARKSDAGTRNGQIALKSSSTTSLGTSTPLATSYGPLTATYTTDPNTGAAWTGSGVNAMQIGVKVAS